MDVQSLALLQFLHKQKRKTIKGDKVCETPCIKAQAMPR